MSCPLCLFGLHCTHSQKEFDNDGCISGLVTKADGEGDYIII